MSAPVPNALRARFEKLIEEGLSGRAAPEALAGNRGALGACNPANRKSKGRATPRECPLHVHVQ